MCPRLAPGSCLSSSTSWCPRTGWGMSSRRPSSHPGPRMVTSLRWYCYLCFVWCAVCMPRMLWCGGVVGCAMYASIAAPQWHCPCIPGAWVRTSVCFGRMSPPPWLLLPPSMARNHHFVRFEGGGGCQSCAEISERQQTQGSLGPLCFAGTWDLQLQGNERPQWALQAHAAQSVGPSPPRSLQPPSRACTSRPAVY